MDMIDVFAIIAGAVFIVCEIYRLAKEKA